MKIMVYSIGAWDNTNATGNTFSNLFGGKEWEKDEFFNIYMRDASPNNKVCNHYFRVTLKDMVKHFFSKEKIGVAFNSSNTNNNNDNSNAIKERKIIDIIHRYPIKLIYFFANWIYRRKKWINKKLINYIESAKPDIFYAHVNNFAFLLPLIKTIKDKSDAKIVLLLTDNLYEDINNKSIFDRKELKKEYKEILDLSDELYAITEELKTEYGKIFNKNIKILRKGCSFEYPVQNKVNETIRFVYAGNLYYGRDEVLSRVVNAIRKNNNSNNKKAFLEIYTGDTITKELKEKLEIDNCSRIMGKREYDEIMRIENNSDYVMHVESFEKEQVQYVKYSFSTKIIDCMQSGSGFIGIGPSNISSIKYIERIPGAHTICSLDEIERAVIDLVNNKNIVKEANEIRKYALENHDIVKNQIELRKAFHRLCGNKKGE